MHRKPSRPFPTKIDNLKLTEVSLPYLQPKAELEDEQRRRYELHGDHLLHELSGEDEILQIADSTDSLVLPLQGRQDICELSEGLCNRTSSQMAAQRVIEIMGDECAQELECPI